MANAGRVLGEVEAWARRFEAGSVRLWGIRQPRMEPGERFGGKVPSVGVQARDASEASTSWLDGPGSPGGGWHWSHSPLGALYVTDRRAFVHGNTPTDIRREWRWDQQSSVTLLPVPIGVAIVGSAGPERVDVVGSEWNRLVLGSTPRGHDLVVRWLEVEAAFALHQGRLDAWLAALPGRLSGSG